MQVQVHQATIGKSAYLATVSKMALVGLQAVYLLDTVPPAKQLLKLQHKASGITRAMFSLCSRLVTVVSDRREPCFTTYDRSGRILSQFQDGSWDPSTAFARGHRLAIAQPDQVRVWDLQSGQLLGSTEALWDEYPRANAAAAMAALAAFAAAPAAADEDDSNSVEHQGPPPVAQRALVAANRSGCKLAFLGASSHALHLYDAVTLEALACLQPAGDIECLAVAARSGYLAWAGSGSWLLLRCPEGNSYAPFQEMGLLKLQDLVVFGAGAGGRSFKQLLHCDSMDEQLQATSPDGRFLCTYQTLRFEAHIKVYDLRSGSLMLAHESELPGLPSSCSKSAHLPQRSGGAAVALGCW